jgi:hypothetical protein
MLNITATESRIKLSESSITIAICSKIFNSESMNCTTSFSSKYQSFSSSKHRQRPHTRTLKRHTLKMSEKMSDISQSVNRLINQSQSIRSIRSVNQINQISQSVDQSASVIQISLRQASLQSLYSQLLYNSFYAAINQLYHLYNQSLYALINQYALFESLRSSYISNQIRFISQASQSNLSQSTQSFALASQSSSSLFASASHFGSESVQFSPSYVSND